MIGHGGYTVRCKAVFFSQPVESGRSGARFFFWGVPVCVFKTLAQTL